MINIVHQKVTSKPPISQKFTKSPRNAGERERSSEKKTKEEIKDCNQNIIETDSCSLDQLCSMISDLEQSLVQEVVAVETCTLPAENPAAFIDLDHMIDKEDCGFSGTSASTYDDIMSFLGTLEQDCPVGDFESSPRPEKLPEEIYQLQSLIKNPNQALSDKTKDDLATALLQLEDREATLKLLKEELKNERKAACDKLDSQRKAHVTELQTQKTKYQNIIRRHQKFVEQLIEEKKQLSDKCNNLAINIKDMEIKYQKESKLAMDKHAVEIQRVKEMCLAGEKVRRERWLEAKKNKIKESTVKGLEPELRNMIDAHQKEVLEIRSVHMKELQDVELRAIRRANQQLEELRKFFEDLQLEKKKFAEELERRDTERDAELQRVIKQSQAKVEKLTTEFEVDRKKLRVDLEAEREAWVENFKKQQSSKFEMAEARVRDECNRERDRQIELAIARIEKETREVKVSLQKSAESKLKSLREKYEAELEVARESERIVREKLEVCEGKVDGLEKELRRVECKLSKCSVELQDLRKSEEKLTEERDHAKKIARMEIEKEKKVLEDKNDELYREIERINCNRDSNLAQLYSRIRLIVTQKDVAIKSLRRECDEARNKCDHLEKLIDQQRKEYVLKTL
ncbi:Similar to cep131: Centrosomal protein of 131 kDa (Danio rerio) [Cotesia congregata]|uniref:Similar to cep131: Centrosomal protein of 131 kDa (Danio rerio) n=1 Tax=Cotesia congregata TaxID=51543 RepID=A0A8J2MJ87_COTCN|nr:Similar to cep131: Centrosomal protein of 131 kDa (Danio rerio) [Cotesia congregata]